MKRRERKPQWRGHCNGGDRLRPMEIVLGSSVIAMALMLMISMWFVMMQQRYDARSSPEPVPQASSLPRPIAEPVQPNRNGDIHIPAHVLEGFEKDSARFFTSQTDDGPPIRFFIVPLSSGQYLAALDACRACAEDDLGFAQSGDQLICRRCDYGSPIDMNSSERPDCQPVRLEAPLRDRSLRISASELKSLARDLAP